MGVKEKEKKKAHWWSGSSCFGGETECDLVGTERERKSVRKRIWWRIVGKKKTVLEKIVNGAPTGEMKKHTSDEKKHDMNHKEKNKAVLIDQDQNQKQQKSISSNSIRTATNQPKSTVQHKASKCDYRTEPAPLYQMLDPVITQTQTRLSHSGPPTFKGAKYPQRKPIGDFDTKGVSVLTVIIALVLLFGRGFAILCVCAWFYIVFRLKSDVSGKKNKTKKKDEDFNLDSEEYKKMVVLRGFLERDKKRLAYRM